MTTFAALKDGNYTGEIIDLPDEFAMRGYVNLEKFPIPAESKPISFDYESNTWVLEPITQDPAVAETLAKMTKKAK
jgi:hypothetical protein